MPEYLHLPPVAQAVLTITGVVLAVIRLLTASKAFWWRFPEWLQKGLPAALVALGTLPKALEMAKSWLDIAVALVFAVGAWFTASRGDQRPVEPPPSKPNDPNDTVRIIPGGPTLLLLFLAFAVHQQGCASPKPPCDEARLRAIDKDYAAKVIAVCLPRYDSKEACPEWPALQAEHRRQLREACP